MLSSDPRDLIRKIPSAAPQQIEPEHPTETVLILKNEDGTETILNNPVGSDTKKFNVLTFVLGGILSFWYFVISKFWYMIPGFIVIMFLSYTPESITAILDQGLTAGDIWKSIFYNMFWASGLSLVAPWIVGKRLQQGIATSRGNMFWMQFPSLFFAMLTFYNISSIIFLTIKGVF